MVFLITVLSELFKPNAEIETVVTIMLHSKTNTNLPKEGDNRLMIIKEMKDDNNTTHTLRNITSFTK